VGAQEFATGGADHVVRLYDGATCRPSRTLDHGDNNTTFGHGSNVFSLAWSHEDHNMLVSGGWDKTVQVRGDGINLI
jgi:WD40 repeat protein